MTVTEKIVRVMFNIGKGIAVLFLLYFFIIAIDVLGASFQLVAGQYRAQQPVLKHCCRSIFVLWQQVTQSLEFWQEKSA